MMRCAIWPGMCEAAIEAWRTPRTISLAFCCLAYSTIAFEISLPYVIAQTGGSMVVPLLTATRCKASVKI